MKSTRWRHRRSPGAIPPLAPQAPYASRLGCGCRPSRASESTTLAPEACSGVVELHRSCRASLLATTERGLTGPCCLSFMLQPPIVGLHGRAMLMVSLRILCFSPTATGPVQLQVGGAPGPRRCRRCVDFTYTATWMIVLAGAWRRGTAVASCNV